MVLAVLCPVQHLGPGQQRGQPAAVVGGGGRVPAAGHQDTHAAVGDTEVAGGIVDIYTLSTQYLSTIYIYTILSTQQDQHGHLGDAEVADWIVCSNYTQVPVCDFIFYINIHL